MSWVSSPLPRDAGYPPGSNTIGSQGRHSAKSSTSLVPPLRAAPQDVAALAEVILEDLSSQLESGRELASAMQRQRQQAAALPVPDAAFKLFINVQFHFRVSSPLE